MDSHELSEEMKALFVPADNDHYGIFERGADPVLAEIARRQGFDALPQKATDTVAVYREAAKTRFGLLSRGVALPEQAAAFKSGEYWPGKGDSGSGTYFMCGEENRATAIDLYGEGPGTGIIAALPDTANIADWMEIHDLRQEYMDSLPQNEDGLLDDRESFSGSVWRNEGTLAAALGYDAITDADHHDYLIVLNRGALIVSP
ncbi:hypothetical protein [Leifsonia sp. Leaf264]|uniref:hypothetical protein n=1 Tax=Leifsonia sp. Leaf264 TaxID=1736314 RepID=UPI0012F8433F|nr:hypothetical protein [Leifsonia sp. Leaf264]